MFIPKRGICVAGLFGSLVFVCGCGKKSIDVVKDITLDGPGKPIAVFFEPLPQETKAYVNVFVTGTHSDSFVVVAEDQQAALEAVKSAERTVKPGTVLLGKALGEEAAKISVTIPKSKGFAVVVYVWRSSSESKGPIAGKVILLDHY